MPLSFFFQRLLSLILSLLGCRFSKNVSRRLEGILSWKDYLQIILPSFLIPILSYLLITRLTPLGCLDWALQSSKGLPFALNLGLTLYLLFFLPMIITAIIVRRKLAELSLAKRESRWIWLPVIATLFALLASWTFRYLGSPAVIISAVAAIIAFWGWLGHSLQMTWGKKRSFMARIIGLRALSISFACLAILMTTLFLPLSLRETYWVQKEAYIPSQLSVFHLNSLEYHLDQEVKRRLFEQMGNSPLFN